MRYRDLHPKEDPKGLLSNHTADRFTKVVYDNSDYITAHNVKKVLSGSYQGVDEENIAEIARIAKENGETRLYRELLNRLPYDPSW